jgi:hypothetical protein
MATLRMQALSVVAPWGQAIASGRKTIEVRSWIPATWPIDDLLIVENHRRLTIDAPEDPDGRAVAIVRVVAVRPWQPSDAEAACSPYEPGWHAWVLADVRPVHAVVPVVARRRLYWTKIDDAHLSGTATPRS